MKKFSHTLNIAVISLTLLITVILTGCKNNAAGPEEEEHFPIGAVLKVNENEIVRYEGPESISGSVTVASGKETDLISIYFLDEHGDEFQPDVSEYSLHWEVADTTVAVIKQYEDEGEWNFHIAGKSTGSTTVAFELLHGSEGHGDITAAGIPVTVE